MKTDSTLRQPANESYPERSDAALGAARRNALRRIVRCLFAEEILDKSSLIFAPQGRSAWLPLWHRHAIIFFDDLRAAPADTFLNHGPITLLERTGARALVTAPDQLIDLLCESFDHRPSEEGIAGLKADVENSIDNDARARIYRDVWNADLRQRIRSAGASGLIDYLRKHENVRDAAVLLDQWGSLEGHPFYPTWKTKPGLSPQEVAQLSPEFGARVAVRIAALRADMAYIERMPHVGSYRAWFAENFPALSKDWAQQLNARRLNEQDWLPLPIHVWQLEHYICEEYAAEIADGLLIIDGPDIETLPTMSFRTMMPREPESAPFIKLPMALWLTSEQRSLQAKSIHMGPRISTVLKQILLAEKGFDGTLEIFPEEVALHYRHAMRQEDGPGRHLSVTYRATQEAFARTDGLLPVVVAALFNRSPSSHRPLVTELIERDGIRPGPDIVEAFFRQYARVVTRPVIGIYLLYGIGLEAHQQNTSVLFGPDAMPRAILIRDFGDARAYAPLLSERGYELEPYVHPGILPTVFTDDIAPVRSFVLNACFVCHLHELALLLTDEYELGTARLWQILGEETQSAFAAVAARVHQTLWHTERAAFLEHPWTARSLLRMHLLRYANYRLQHRLPNPLLPTGT